MTTKTTTKSRNGTRRGRRELDCDPDLRPLFFLVEGKENMNSMSSKHGEGSRGMQRDQANGREGERRKKKDGVAEEKDEKG